MTIPLDRPPAAEAGPELLVLQKWEAFASWFLNHTGRWPKAARFTLTQRLENHALDVTELLVQARYDPRRRRPLLHDVNLRLERMRLLCRVARDARVENNKGFESTRSAAWCTAGVLQSAIASRVTARRRRHEADRQRVGHHRLVRQPVLGGGGCRAQQAHGPRRRRKFLPANKINGR